MRKTTTTLGLSALVASLLVGATPTEARERNGWATIPFRATSTGGAQEELAAECAPDGASCIGSYRLTSPTFGGDLDGASIGAEIATISPSGTVSVRITSIFTGSVRGCGYGTVVYTNDGTFNSSTATSFRFAQPSERQTSLTRAAPRRSSVRSGANANPDGYITRHLSSKAYAHPPTSNGRRNTNVVACRPRTT